LIGIKIFDLSKIARSQIKPVTILNALSRHFGAIAWLPWALLAVETPRRNVKTGQPAATIKSPI